MNQIPTDSALSLGVLLAGIPILITLLLPLIIFILWLTFGIGTLTRLTDIKYKLDDLIDAVKASGNVTPSILNLPTDKVDSPEKKLEPEIRVDTGPSPFTVELSKEIHSLKKPSKFLIISLGSSFVLAVFIIVLTLIINHT